MSERLAVAADTWRAHRGEAAEATYHDQMVQVAAEGEMSTLGAQLMTDTNPDTQTHLEATLSADTDSLNEADSRIEAHFARGGDITSLDSYDQWFARNMRRGTYRDHAGNDQPTNLQTIVDDAADVSKPSRLSDILSEGNSDSAQIKAHTKANKWLDEGVTPENFIGVLRNVNEGVDRRTQFVMRNTELLAKPIAELTADEADKITRFMNNSNTTRTDLDAMQKAAASLHKFNRTDTDATGKPLGTKPRYEAQITQLEGDIATARRVGDTRVEASLTTQLDSVKDRMNKIEATQYQRLHSRLVANAFSEINKTADAATPTDTSGNPLPLAPNGGETFAATPEQQAKLNALDSKRKAYAEATASKRRLGVVRKKHNTAVDKARDEYEQARDAVGGDIAKSWRDKGMSEADIEALSVTGAIEEIVTAERQIILARERLAEGSKLAPFYNWWARQGGNKLLSKAGVVGKIKKMGAMGAISFVPGVVAGAASSVVLGPVVGAGVGVGVGRGIARGLAGAKIGKEADASTVAREQADANYVDGRYNIRDAQQANEVLETAHITDTIEAATDREVRRNRIRLGGAALIGAASGLAGAWLSDTVFGGNRARPDWAKGDRADEYDAFRAADANNPDLRLSDDQIKDIISTPESREAFHDFTQWAQDAKPEFAAAHPEMNVEEVDEAVASNFNRYMTWLSSVQAEDPDLSPEDITSKWNEYFRTRS